ncbi:MAG: hypothetical protein IT459_24045 [Planctomycetes bacterium]|nr:hypothetical protein [Planctomycetota bacterium]
MTSNESRNPQLPTLMWVIIDTKGMSQEDLQKPINPEQREFLKAKGWLSAAAESLAERAPIDVNWCHPNIRTGLNYTGQQALLVTAQYQEYFNDEQPAAFQEPSRWYTSDRQSEFNEEGGAWDGIKNSRSGRFVARVFNAVMGRKSGQFKPEGHDL